MKLYEQNYGEHIYIGMAETTFKKDLSKLAAYKNDIHLRKYFGK